MEDFANGGNGEASRGPTIAGSRGPRTSHARTLDRDGLGINREVDCMVDNEIEYMNSGNGGASRGPIIAGSRGPRTSHAWTLDRDELGTDREVGCKVYNEVVDSELNNVGYQNCSNCVLIRLRGGSGKALGYKIGMSKTQKRRQRKRFRNELKKKERREKFIKRKCDDAEREILCLSIQIKQLEKAANSLEKRIKENDSKVHIDTALKTLSLTLTEIDYFKRRLAKFQRQKNITATGISTHIHRMPRKKRRKYFEKKTVQTEPVDHTMVV